VSLNISGITVEVHRKKVKNMTIYVKPPYGTVTVSAPFSVSDDRIEKFVLKKADWIRKQVSKFDGVPVRAEREYVTGETLYVWGKPYSLRLECGNMSSVVLSENEMIMTVSEDSTVSQREDLVREWYREVMIAETERLLPGWEEAVGLIPSGFQVRYMKTRWGTCNTRTGKIYLNVQLAKRPKEYLEYVILHELVHLAERKHNELFASVLDVHMPNWREIKAALNGHTLDHMD